VSPPRVATKTTAETTLERQFAALAEPDADRVAAFDAFAKAGLPTRRDEAWHFTDLRAAMASAPPPAPPPDAARLAEARAALDQRARFGGARFVLVDGYFVEALSDPAPAGALRCALAEWAPASRLLEALSNGTFRPDPLVSLNDALAPRRGLSLRVDQGAQVSAPIEIAHFAGGDAPTAEYSRLTIAAGAGARLSLVETFFGARDGRQRNAVASISVGAGARCELVGVVDDEAELHVESQIVALGAEAAFDAFALIAGGRLARRQIFAGHVEPGAEIALSGLSLLDGERHADTTLIVRHGAPRGKSREFYRHIVADEAVGVYQGKVIVAPHAQKTDGAMKSQAILLSPRAAMNNKPELEILADDVACGHGATVAALDPEQAFYLQARGLPKREAEAMLLEAFAAEAIGRANPPELQENLIAVTRAWLARRAGGTPA